MAFARKHLNREQRLTRLLTRKAHKETYDLTKGARKVSELIALTKKRLQIVLSPEKSPVFYFVDP